MKITKIFKSKEVEIFKQENNLILPEKRKNLKHAFELLTSLPNDFYAFKRKDLLPQKR